MSPTVSVAPMVDVTGRHFRYLMRLMTKRTALWTPMYVARQLATRRRAVVDSMLRFHPSELGRREGSGAAAGLVAQLGGDDPRTMLAAARRCEALGYSEVNINLGCPARNAQAGNHGASLMRPPHDRLLELVKRMTGELHVPVSVKLRIGVDEHESYAFLHDLTQRLHEDGGCRRFVVHARKALLGGLPPGLKAPSSLGASAAGAADFVTTRQNRLNELVPLRPEWVHRLKREMCGWGSGGIERVEINGGIRDLQGIRTHLAAGMDGVMLGRLARDDPFFFTQVDSAIFDEPDAFAGMSGLEARCEVLRQYADYCTGEQREGHETSREELTKPMNRMFEAPELSEEKKAFAQALRGGCGTGRYGLFGDQILAAVEIVQEGRFERKQRSSSSSSSRRRRNSTWGTAAGEARRGGGGGEGRGKAAAARKGKGKGQGGGGSSGDGRGGGGADAAQGGQTLPAWKRAGGGKNKFRPGGSGKMNRPKRKERAAGQAGGCLLKHYQLTSQAGG